MFKFLEQNKLIITLLLAVIVTGGTLMVVSQNVYEKQSSIREKSRDLVEQEWELRTLKAEWAYLSRPDRIEELSSAMGHDASAPTIVAIQSISRAEEQDIQPVSMAVPTPPNKPFYMIRPVAVKSNETVAKSAPRQQGAKPSNDFSSLLKTIGGAP